MCGIVGLFLKDASLEPKLGGMLSTMLSTMCERGPDSAGFAVYGTASEAHAKLTLQSAEPERDFAGLDALLAPITGEGCGVRIKSTHAVVTVPASAAEGVRALLQSARPGIRVMSVGQIGRAHV